jgi:glycosyltransferase involved in cell wall biosynthesis
MEPTVRPFPKGPIDRWKGYGTLASYDVVFIQRKRLKGWELKWVRSRARCLVYDFDDAVMYRDRLSRDPHSPSRRRHFWRMIEACDLVLAGNRFLYEEAIRHQNRVEILPTCLDLERYAPRGQDVPSSCITLGWIGDTGSIHYLETFKPILEALGKEIPNLQLKILSSRFIECERLRVIPVPWRADTELRELQTFDIGIMPVPDDPWSQGKCGLKLLQYMAAGVPVVCSPVGVNAEIVRDGTEGLFARSEGEWIDQIRKLALDAELRHRMGTAAFDRVKNAYSLQSHAPRLVQMLRRLPPRTDAP